MTVGTVTQADKDYAHAQCIRCACKQVSCPPRVDADVDGRAGCEQKFPHTNIFWTIMFLVWNANSEPQNEVGDSENLYTFHLAEVSDKCCI